MASLLQLPLQKLLQQISPGEIISGSLSRGGGLHLRWARFRLTRYIGRDGHEPGTLLSELDTKDIPIIIGYEMDSRYIF